METIVSHATSEVLIADNQPTVLIGERINPTGRKKLSESLQAGDMSVVCRNASSQVNAGADILDINVGGTGQDESELLPRVIQAVMETVDVPLSLDSENPAALEAALKIYKGKPIINSVNGQENSLNEILPLVKEYGTAVIGLTMDDDGIPTEPDHRLAIAHKIVERAEKIGIPRQDVIIDCLVLTIATDSNAALVTLETIRKVQTELGINQTLGASNLSYGLPDRTILNSAFLTMAISAGVTCPCVNVARTRPAILATDLVLGRDSYAMRYIKDYRRRQQSA